MKRLWLGGILGLFGILVLAAPGRAAGPFGVSVAGSFAPWIGGDAASGDEAPKYSDAFKNGWGGRAEAYFDVMPELRVLGGFLYEKFSGDTYEGVDFDDLKLWSIYVGAKYRLLPGSPWRPYVFADVGYAHIDSVNISGSIDELGDVSASAYDDTNTYLADAGAGVEFMVMPQLGIYADVRAQVFGKPEDGDLEADADVGWTLPITVGVNYNF